MPYLVWVTSAGKSPPARGQLLLVASVGLLATCGAVALAGGTAPRVAHGSAAVAPLMSGLVRRASPIRPQGSSSPLPTRTLGRPCKPEMAHIEGVCIDRYEARLLSKLPDGSLIPHPAHARPTSGPYFAEARAGVKPQAYISRTEAAQACTNAGKRLCSAREWFRACTGSSGTTYPYGVRFEAGRCNVGRPHVLSLVHGADPRGWSYADFNDPKLNQKPGFLALTGEFEGCVSDGGVYDLVGNLHEWVADRVDETLTRKLPVSAVIRRRLGRSTGNGLFMGGFFSTTDQHGPGCTFLTAAHEPGYHDYSTGFRCCADASEPK